MLAIIPFIKFIGIPLISLTGNPDSQLAKASDAVLCTRVDANLEPLGMVPTASTTVALALGDAMAIALLNDKNFSLNDFARFHPGGAIGKRLLLKVKDLMHQGMNCPEYLTIHRDGQHPKMSVKSWATIVPKHRWHSYRHHH